MLDLRFLSEEQETRGSTGIAKAAGCQYLPGLFLQVSCSPERGSRALIRESRAEPKM